MTSAKRSSVAADAIRVLKARATPTRLRGLELLKSTPAMLTHQEIATRPGSDVPVARVTLYRVLDWLVEHQLAHRTIDDARAFRYAAAAEPTGHEDHIHFRCDTGGGVFCLDSVPLWTPCLPGGFRSRQVEVSIRGGCSYCAAPCGQGAR